MSKVEVSERRISLYGNSAVVRLQVLFEGQAGEWPFSSMMRITRVYAKLNGTWKMVAGHSSEVKE